MEIGFYPNKDDIAKSHRTWLADAAEVLNDEVRDAAKRNGATYVMPADAAAHSGSSYEL